MPEAGTPAALTVLIASPLEAEHVARIAAVAPGRLRVVHAPELLPRPRYAADHHGVPPALTAEQQARWRRLLAEADILFDFDWMEPERLRQNAPRLRWVQATSAGIGEFVARLGLAGSAILFTTAAGVHTVPLSEFAVMSLLYFVKDVPFLLREQAAHRWQRYTARQLAGARLLLVGLGQVGRGIARSCAALGVEVWGMRRTATPDRPEGVSRIVTRAELRGALAEVDALVLACPITAETRGLIGRAEIACLPPRAVIVNVARGGVIDQAAMTEALRDGRLAGAALDVAEVEPLPPDDPLWSLPNVIISPHSASTVAEENGRITDIFVKNLRRFLDGAPMLNRFEAARGY